MKVEPFTHGCSGRRLIRHGDIFPFQFDRAFDAGGAVLVEWADGDFEFVFAGLGEGVNVPGKRGHPAGFQRLSIEGATGHNADFAEVEAQSRMLDHVSAAFEGRAIGLQSLGIGGAMWLQVYGRGMCGHLDGALGSIR